MVRAADIIAGRWSPAEYPHRYVVVWHGKELVMKFRGPMVDSVFRAVEILESQGWELVSTSEAMAMAAMRRTS